MNFGPNHYVPVLKVKLGEKAALRTIAPTLCGHITPLLEIVERKDKPIQDHINTAFKQLAESVRPFMRCLLDVRDIESAGPSAATAVFRRAASDGIVFTPVTGITRTADVAPALAHQTNGIAIRLTRKEFEYGGLARRLRSFVSAHHLTPEQTDLIVDLGPVDEMLPIGVIALMNGFLSEVPDKNIWRTFTLSACAFPKKMSAAPRNGHAIVARMDWSAWKDNLHAHRTSLQRLPTFSDCLIQHTAGVEGFDPRIMSMSAAIRYTLPDNWLLIRGESLRVTPGRTQFRALATKLVTGVHSVHFSGVEHCSGCRSMCDAANGAPKLASAVVWRRLGTTHHITMVMDGLSSLPWP